MQMEKIIEVNSLEELDMVAKAVIESLDGRTVVAFDAPMGAGKTTIISRIAALLGAEDSVTSPTFAIVNQYEGRDRTIYHFDMYRIERVEEARLRLRGVSVVGRVMLSGVARED